MIINEMPARMMTSIPIPPPHYLLIQSVLLCLCSFPRLAISSENIGHEHSNHPIEQYYFSREIDFLAKQSMILGGHDDASPTGHSLDSDQITRLRFIEKSLRLELSYIRRLKAEKATANIDKDILNNKIRSTQPSETNEVGNDNNKTGTVVKDKQTYDYDRYFKAGFAAMHHKLDCREHAYDQEKEIYTSENWKTLWNKFLDSTLFPFPIPKVEECHDQPFYIAQTTDNKGRGAFALRNISKGTLVHAGHPNTVFFPDNKSFFRFLASLPQMMACDVMEWAWQQDLTDTGSIVLCLNLNEAVFFNDGGRDSMTNIAIKYPTSLDFYASRDIEEGEELLYDYGNFDMDDEEMDL